MSDRRCETGEEQLSHLKKSGLQKSEMTASPSQVCLCPPVLPTEALTWRLKFKAGNGA